MGFIDLVKARARADKKTVVLPESMDKRTWETAGTVLKEDIASLIIIGTPEDIADHSKGLDVSGATMINPQAYEEIQEYIDLFVELRRSKGMTPGEAKEIIMSDYIYYGCLMIKSGDTGRLVSGAYHSTANTLRLYLQIVEIKSGTKLVFAFFLMMVPDCEYGAEGTFIFADSGLNQNPNSEELAAIAKSSADSPELLVQKEVRVAMLSHFTEGSARHSDVGRVAEATRIVKELYPELKLDGELQSDAALVPGVAPSKVPGSKVVGKANVLMFPDLDVGNIGYKLVQRLAKAEAYGPVTQGIAKPANDLPRGCRADDIVGIVVITVVQVQIEQAGIKGEISMNILAIDCGSSSLKYQLINSTSEAVLVKGLHERIGIKENQTTYQPAGGEKGVTVSPTPTHTQAIQMVLDALTNDKTGVIESLDEIGTVGHRIVHGGEAFTASTPITEEAVKAIEGCSDLAPLHNSASLIGIRACQELMPNTSMVGVSDTAFHQIMPEKAYLYGLPYEYYEKYKARGYGFYRTSHSYISKRTAGVLGCPYDSPRTMICHLGNGSNISAVLNGKSVGTGVGLTPLRGLVVRTRSGDVDPGALQFIMHKENMDIDRMLNVPNKKPGVYGMSGVSSDFYDVENAANGGDKKTEVALESFAYRVAKYVGVHAATTSGVDAIAFTAGMGKNDKIIKKKVCEYPGFLGIGVDNKANSERRQEIVISTPDSKVSALAVPANEKLAVARETLALIK